MGKLKQKIKMPPYPMCRSNRDVIATGELFYCSAHKLQFDTQDDGDYSDRNPAARLEREERRQERKRHQGGRR